MTASKTALITGATDGVGRVVARRLAADGWRILAHGRSLERGQSLVREIESAGGKATFLPADLASLAEVRRLADAVKAGDRQPAAADQQRRHRLGRRGAWPAGERRRPRAALRGELSRGLPAHPPAAAAGQGERAGADRQRLLRRPAGDRLRRRHADQRLQRHARLLPEQAGADPVHDRPGRGAEGLRKLRELPPSLDLHEHHHGAAVGHHADQQRGDRRRRDPAARRFAEARGQERPLLQRDERGAPQRPGQRPEGARATAQAQPGADGVGEVLMLFRTASVPLAHDHERAGRSRSGRA